MPGLLGRGSSFVCFVALFFKTVDSVVERVSSSALLLSSFKQLAKDCVSELPEEEKALVDEAFDDKALDDNEFANWLLSKSD